MTASPCIIPVHTAADLLATIALFRDYAALLDVDLGYQDFDGDAPAICVGEAPPPARLAVPSLTNQSRWVK